MFKTYVSTMRTAEMKRKNYSLFFRSAQGNFYFKHLKLLELHKVEYMRNLSYYFLLMFSRAFLRFSIAVFISAVLALALIDLALLISGAPASSG